MINVDFNSILLLLLLLLIPLIPRLKSLNLGNNGVTFQSEGEIKNNVKIEIEEEDQIAKKPKISSLPLQSKGNKKIDAIYSASGTKRIEHFLEIEKAVLRKISRLYPGLLAQVKFQNKGSSYFLDALQSTNDVDTIFEIKIFRHKLLPYTIGSISRQFNYLLDNYIQINPNRQVRGVIVLVSDFNRAGSGFEADYLKYLSENFELSFKGCRYPLATLRIDLNELNLLEETKNE
jgi:hypothetical protein